jgi:hypothetical protein
MQRMQSPSLRPFERGAARWQHRSASATTFPELSRQNNKGSCVIVLASIPSPGTSCDQAATYQVFLRKVVVIFRFPDTVAQIYACGTSYAICKTASKV